MPATTSRHHAPLSLAGAAALAVLPVAAASILGQVATTPNLEPWYRELSKPAFTPPSGLFAPMWTTLYVMMAYAVFRVLRLPAGTPGRGAALAAFYAQLALNAAWSWMFFAAHNPLAGLLNIVPQWLLILLAIDRFRRVDRLAAGLLVPLACWVAYAGALNFEIWRLNG